MTIARLAHWPFVLAGVLVGCAGLPASPPNPFDGLSEADRGLAQATRQKALETGQRGEEFQWSGTDAGTGGSITVLATLRRNDGRYCRRFRETVQAGAASDSFEAVFCRTDDGTWLP